MTLVLVLLTAAPQLAAPGLTPNGAPKEKADAFNEYFAQQVSQLGVRVVTGSEIAAVLGLERQKQLLGCGDEATSCVAELAGALGVTGLITGSVALIGTEWVVILRVVAADGSRVIASYTTRAGDERAVLDLLGDHAADLAGKLRPKAAGGIAGAWPFLAGGAGVLLASGAVCTVISRLAEAQLRGGEGISDFAGVQSARSRGELTQTLSLVLYGVGSAAAIAAAVLFGVSRSEVQASVAVVPGGAFGVVTWRLP